MEKILIVDDSDSFTGLLKNRIESELDFQVIRAASYLEAEGIINNNGEFFVGVIDSDLPDAPEGKALDLAIANEIPSIVITGGFDEEVRKICWSKRVIDYILKEGPYSLEYIIALIRRISLNRSTKILVVDDSSAVRKYIRALLEIHRYNVFEAADGVEALQVLAENQDVRLVITDYNMPVMDGFELLNKIRMHNSQDEVAVIGISSMEDEVLSARFIKNGANDFIKKPFSNEEFYCRVTQNINLIEKIMEIKDSANKDFLTGLFNRRYFYDIGGVLYENAKRQNLTVTVAMIDIDNFKKTNDSYGHLAGDEVLKRVALRLRNSFRATDIVARFGGEEFCVIACNMASGQEFRLFDSVRESIERMEINVAGGTIKTTISVGVCRELDSLEEMIKKADAKLYKAKTGGRNKVTL